MPEHFQWCSGGKRSCSELKEVVRGASIADLFDELDKEDRTVAREEERSVETFASSTSMACTGAPLKLYIRNLMTEVENTRGIGEAPGRALGQEEGREGMHAGHWWWNCLGHKNR